MATLPVAGPEVMPLERVPTDQLEPLFEVERAAWRDVLGWDTPGSVQILTRAVDWGVVRGAVLCMAGEPVGYLVLQPGIAETRLCGVLLPPTLAGAAPKLVAAALAEAPGTSRIEGQLLAFGAQEELDMAFRRLGLAVEPRDFLQLEADAPQITRLTAPQDRISSGARVKLLDSADLPDCARVLVAAHAGGVEARINQAFRTVPSALSYLRELVESGGCGAVHDGASSVVSWRGRIAGFCIGTTTSPGIGHVPQIALEPSAQGIGLGTALLSHAVESLVDEGCGRVTLSVSRANRRAAAWYRRTGFLSVLAFASYHRDAPA